MWLTVPTLQQNCDKTFDYIYLRLPWRGLHILFPLVCPIFTAARTGFVKNLSNLYLGFCTEISDSTLLLDTKLNWFKKTFILLSSKISEPFSTQISDEKGPLLLLASVSRERKLMHASTPNQQRTVTTKPIKILI